MKGMCRSTTCPQTTYTAYFGVFWVFLIIQYFLSTTGTNIYLFTYVIKHIHAVTRVPDFQFIQEKKDRRDLIFSPMTGFQIQLDVAFRDTFFIPSFCF